MGTTKDDFQSFGSSMAGTMLRDVDFNILADIPSGPFDLETSSEPSSNSTSSSVQRWYDGHNKGSVSGRSSLVSGGYDWLNCCEKHCPSKVAFSKFEFALVPFLCSVGMDDVSQLMAFQKSLELGFSLWKKSFLASLSFVTTWFFSFLYFTASLLEDLARLKCRFLTL